MNVIQIWGVSLNLHKGTKSARRGLANEREEDYEITETSRKTSSIFKSNCSSNLTIVVQTSYYLNVKIRINPKQAAQINTKVNLQ